VAVDVPQGFPSVRKRRFALPAFSVEWSDDDAINFIMHLMANSGDVQFCPVTARPDLPAIRWRIAPSQGGLLGPPSSFEYDEIHPGKSGAERNDRFIANCGFDPTNPNSMTDDSWRFEKLKASTELKEAAPQCMGTDFQANGCAAMVENPSRTPASYGWTQFLGATMVGRLVQYSNPAPSTTEPRFTPTELEELGFTANGANTGLRQALQAAQSRANRAIDWYRQLDGPNGVSNGNFNANAYWAANGATFTNQTGLVRADFDNMVASIRFFNAIAPYVGQTMPNGNRIRITDIPEPQRTQIRTLAQQAGITRDGSINTYLSTPIEEEARQGFASRAIFVASGVTNAADRAQVDQVYRALFGNNTRTQTGVFTEKRKFDFISDAELRKNLNWANSNYPNDSENDRAMRIGYLHNTGNHRLVDHNNINTIRRHPYNTGGNTPINGFNTIWKNTHCLAGFNRDIEVQGLGFDTGAPR
jgi:hypothetical protein